MLRNPLPDSAGNSVVSFLVVLNAIVLEQGFVHNARWYRILPLTLLLLLTVLLCKQRPAK